MYRRIRPEAVHATIDRLAHRIDERFPGSSLHGVARELLDHSSEAQARIERIRSPIIAYRVLAGLLLVGIAAVLVTVPMRLQTGDVRTLLEFVQVLEPALGTVFFIAAFTVFAVSLETRVKRSRAMEAIYELRSIAHIIDMHQLTKDPAVLTSGGQRTASSPERTMSTFELGRYFDYCSELLSLVSKLAALYIEHFHDPSVVAAVDDVDRLATGLSRKIWQKIMLLNQSA